MRLHPDRLDIVFLGGLEVGASGQVGGDADLLGRAVDQLGYGAVAEKMRPDRLAESLAGARFDLIPDCLATHGPTTTVEPEVTSDADLALAAWQ